MMHGPLRTMSISATQRNPACAIVPLWRISGYIQTVVAKSLPRKSRAAGGCAPVLNMGKKLHNSCMFLDWTNWTFWVTAIALVAFGFCLRDIYEQWRFRKVRRNVSDELREVDNLTRRLQAATERLNKVNEEGSRGAPRS